MNIKKYKLQVTFGNNMKNYYQVETIHQFKKDNMIFDYAGLENFRVIINTNNLDEAENDIINFINNLNFDATGMFYS